MPPSGSSRRRLTWSLLVEELPEGGGHRLSGRLAAHTVGAFSKAVDAALASGTVRLRLDCHQVDYISSAGIAALELAAAALSRAGGRLTLVGIHEAVRVSLETSGAGPELDWTGRS